MFLKERQKKDLKRHWKYICLSGLSQVDGCQNGGRHLKVFFPPCAHSLLLHLSEPQGSWAHQQEQSLSLLTWGLQGPQPGPAQDQFFGRGAPDAPGRDSASSPHPLGWCKKVSRQPATLLPDQFAQLLNGTSSFNLISDSCYYLRKSKLPLPVLMNHCTMCAGIRDKMDLLIRF